MLQTYNSFSARAARVFGLIVFFVASVHLDANGLVRHCVSFLVILLNHQSKQPLKRLVHAVASFGRGLEPIVEVVILSDPSMFS